MEFIIMGIVILIVILTGVQFTLNKILFELRNTNKLLAKKIYEKKDERQ